MLPRRITLRCTTLIVLFEIPLFDQQIVYPVDNGMVGNLVLKKKRRIMSEFVTMESMTRFDIDYVNRLFWLTRNIFGNYWTSLCTDSFAYAFCNETEKLKLFRTDRQWSPM